MLGLCRFCGTLLDIRAHLDLPVQNVLLRTPWFVLLVLSATGESVQGDSSNGS